MIRTLSSYYRISTGTADPLRIGLLLDFHHQVPAFVASIIEDIQASNFARIDCLIMGKRVAAPGTGSRSRTRGFNFLAHISDSNQRKNLLYDLYLRLDARMKPADDPLAKVECREMLSGIPVIEIEAPGNRFDPEAMERIRSTKLDVLVQFGSCPLSDDLLKAARYGVWSYHHGDPEFYRGTPPYFWEMRESSPLSGVVLQVLNEEQGSGLVLSRSLFATERTFSVSRNRFIPYWGASSLIIQKLKELHEFGWEYVLERVLPPAPYKGKRAVYSTPTNRDMLPWLGAVLLKKALSFPFRRRTVQHWRVANRVNRSPLYDSDAASDFSEFRWIESPKGHYWADPFPFEHGEKHWVFFEDYSYKEKRGSIACSEVSPQGEMGPPLLCLDHANHHYSFPHIFKAGSEIFMIPECSDSNSVDLYRCHTFPDRWVREAALIRGKFVDASVWEYEGLWWLITTSAEPSAGAGCLLLFYSPSLTGDWHFHPANPISADVRQMRCAGRVFQAHNRLIRPSQSGAPDYGYSIGFNEITALSKSRYFERPLKTITPDHWPGLAGIHTYNFAANIEFIDGRYPVPLKSVQAPDRDGR